MLAEKLPIAGFLSMDKNLHMDAYSSMNEHTTILDFGELMVFKSRIIVCFFMDDHGLQWMSMHPYADFYPWIKILQ